MMFLDLTEGDVFSLFYIPICVISLIIWVNIDPDQFFEYLKYYMEAVMNAYYQTMTIKSKEFVKQQEDETQQSPT
jgi:hypothetical protein